jgi:hypothetical protein
LELHTETLSPATTTRIDLATRGVLVIAACVVLAIAASLCHFAVMVDDDVVRAARPAQIGWRNYVFGFVYMHWQGRWASAGLESAVLPRVDLVRCYWALITGVAVINVAGIFVVIRYGLRMQARRAVSMTVVAAAFLWAGLPSPAEAVYWFVGAVENTMDLSLAAIVIVATARARPGFLVTAALGVSAMFVCGFHELYGAMFCCVLATGTAAAFHGRSPNRWTWLTVTICAAVGLIIVLAAPGNAARQKTDGGRHSMQLGYDLRIFLNQFKYLPRVWLMNDPRLIAATILVACTPGTSASAHSVTRSSGPCGRFESAESPLLFSGSGTVQRTVSRVSGSNAAGRVRVNTIPFPWKWAIPAVWLAAVAGGMFGPSLAFGGWMPARTETGVWIVFVTGWFTTVYLWTREGAWRTPALLRYGTRIGRIGLAVTLLTTGNARKAWHDYRHPLRPWHAAVEQRYAVLAAGHGRDVVVAPLPAKPELLRTNEICIDGPKIFNESWAYCFGQKSVRVDPAVVHKPGD